ncbi:hypothetical protein Nepgr_033234 [Nepenthes gracilis]|uniref:Uncharacterized protein n=1 Tax=Nepenthes gracilis TaxID=150966 RepID=A0AAD3TLM1_NEPGR|nr:hypothetical protein Nepgr_033234 [Nepenthes gracilis]
MAINELKSNTGGISVVVLGAKAALDAAQESSVSFPLLDDSIQRELLSRDELSDEDRCSSFFFKTIGSKIIEVASGHLPRRMARTPPCIRRSGPVTYHVLFQNVDGRTLQ